MFENFLTDDCVFCVCFSQVCHIALGLKPASKEEEGQVVRYLSFINKYYKFNSKYFLSIYEHDDGDDN